MKTRREIVAAGMVAAGAAAVPSAWGRPLLSSTPRIGPGTFADGVASGEPGPDAITFWGRLTTDRPRSGARLLVAEDEGLRNVVARAVVPTGEAVDHCLKARIDGLKPGTVYHYAWQSGDDVSPVGRTRTANAADSREPVRLQTSSCQRWAEGFFTGHTHAAAQPLYDLLVFTGDYTYEYESESGVRTDDKPSNDLQSYRENLKLYRSDVGLRELHRLHPCVHIWDDHEVEDNYTENNPAPSALQRAAGYRASFEWMPRMAFPKDRYRIYKPFRLGANCEVLLLDERQYRTGPGDSRSAEPLPFLGRAQMDWLKGRLSALQSAGVTWKILGNQLPVMPLRPINEAGLQNDQWEGFKAERTELLGFIEDQKIDNVVFITGDIHTYITSELNKNFEALNLGTAPSVAVDYVCGSISSSGLAVPEPTVRSASPHVKQFDGANHGYGSLDMNGERLVTEYRIGPLDRPDAPVRTSERFTQPAGQSTFTRQSNPPESASAARRAKSAARAAGRADQSPPARRREIARRARARA